jgi:hypothetical protein
MVCVYSAAMEDKSRGLIDNLYWRKARKQWHCFKRLPRCEVLSRSASARKSPPCAERKSPARRLLCAVKCVIGSK